MNRDVSLGVSLHNKFHIEVKNVVSGKLVQEGFAENIILNQGMTKILNAIGVGSSLFSDSAGLLGYDSTQTVTSLQFGGRIFLGSGTTTPNAADTALTTPVFNRRAIYTTNTISANQLTSSAVQVMTIDASERIGDVYREVGLGGGGGISSVADGTAGTLSTKALIVDGDSNPLTITKADLQVVTVTSTLYLQISHPYGPNLLFRGTGTSVGTTSPWTTVNPLVGILLGGSLLSGGSSNLMVPYTGSPTFTFGSSATTPTQADTGVKTLLTGGTVTGTRTLDAANKKVTYACRVPSTVVGTIAEMSLNIQYRSYALATASMFRLVFPIGDNPPTYDNVCAAAINKTNAQIVDVSVALVFGSL